MKEANRKKEEKIKELQEFISSVSLPTLPNPSRQPPVREPLRKSSWMTCVLPAVNIHTSTSVRTVRSETRFLRWRILSKTIDGVKVLDNISFTLGREDKVAFVGANELAKTTLFKILTGEMEPDEGSYKWGITTTQAYFPKDNTAEFDNDLTIVDWLTQYSPDQGCHLCTWFPWTYAVCRARTA